MYYVQQDPWRNYVFLLQYSPFELCTTEGCSDVISWHQLLKAEKKLEADTRLRSETKDQGVCLLLTEYVLQRQSGYSCLTSVILVSALCIQCWHPLIACRAGQLWKAQQKPDFVSSLRLNLTPASSLEDRAGCCRCWLRMYSGVNKSLLKNKLSSVFYKWISVEMASGLYLLICPYSYFQFSGWNVQPVQSWFLPVNSVSHWLSESLVLSDFPSLSAIAMYCCPI